MLSDKEKEAILHIRDYAAEAQGFVAGMTLDAFIADRRTYLAVTRCLEIISEASRRLSASTTARHPDIPWREIRASGNVYRHEYEHIHEQLIWDTLAHEVPKLLQALEIYTV